MIPPIFFSVNKITNE